MSDDVGAADLLMILFEETEFKIIRRDYKDGVTSLAIHFSHDKMASGDHLTAGEMVCFTGSSKVTLQDFSGHEEFLWS